MHRVGKSLILMLLVFDVMGLGKYSKFPQIKVAKTDKIKKTYEVPDPDAVNLYHYYQRDLDIPTHFTLPEVTSTHRNLVKKMNGGMFKKYNYISTVLPPKIDKTRNYEEFNVYVGKDFKINKILYRYSGPKFRYLVEIFGVNKKISKITIDKSLF